ncbi:MAG: type III pantothenate kinase [Planctomycetes bacterium]|nr:type III pantothenate kinase [Planctomycetota bacterium]
MERTLAFDAGNTQLGWGLFLDGALCEVGSFANDDARWELPHPSWTSLDRVVIASVRSETPGRLREAWPDHPPITILGVDAPIPVPTRVPEPRQVGADRLVNCLAWARRTAHAEPVPAVIVDFGTAITFDVVSAGGAYLGGLILPGPELIARSLERGTSLLPRVRIEPTPELFGRDTLSCIRRGVYGLLRGGVEFHLAALRAQLPSTTRFVATGGGAPSYAPWFESIELVLPYLTLEGVRWAGLAST